MNDDRQQIQIAGAMLGAIAGPLLQLACVALSFRLRDALSLDSYSHAQEFLNHLPAACIIVGGFLGVFTGTALHARSVRDTTALGTTFQSVSWLILILLILLTAPFLLEARWDVPYAHRLFGLCALFSFNAPLQWAVTVAILSKIALNRLRAEEKRARYDAQASA